MPYYLYQQRDIRDLSEGDVNDNDRAWVPEYGAFSSVKAATKNER